MERKARDRREEERRGVRGKDEGRSSERRGEGDYKPGSMRIGKGAKESGKAVEGALGLQSMHGLAGNGFRG